MEKNKNKLFRKYEVYFLTAIIFVVLILLFIFSKIPEKHIYELNNYNKGFFKISGYISNLKEYPNYMTFVITDFNSSIKVISKNKLDIKNGAKIEFICNLQKTQYGKTCYYK